MYTQIRFYYLFIALYALSCNENISSDSFSDTASKLQHVKGIEVLRSGNSKILVSGPLQGRVFTSTTGGKSGKSFGWVNIDKIKDPSYLQNIAGLGGESRMWYAPEFGKFSVFFDPGDPQNDDYMRAPPALDTSIFQVIGREENAITVLGIIEIQNTHGTLFKLAINRKIQILNKTEIELELNVKIPEQVDHVGFSASTIVKNIGANDFKVEDGLLSIWELGCMLTQPDTKVIIPTRGIANPVTTYFTPLADRVSYQDSTIIYNADAQGLNKIGIKPKQSKGIMGSYSLMDNLLSIVKFDQHDHPHYVNSLPNNNDPYKGDVINIFNGEVNDSLGRNWPFYEFESISASEVLKVGDDMTHQQTTFHFDGNQEYLSDIAKDILNYDLKKLNE